MLPVTNERYAWFPFTLFSVSLRTLRLRVRTLDSIVIERSSYAAARLLRLVTFSLHVHSVGWSSFAPDVTLSVYARTFHVLDLDAL